MFKPEESTYEIINERSFAYELYRVWSDLVKDKYPELVINAEIPKKINKKYKKMAGELFGRNVRRFLPDMVLHGGQHDSGNQEIICEIKLFKNLKKTSLIKDMKKLLAYTKDKILYHPFNHGVFILIGGNKDNFKPKITNFDDGLKEQLKNSKIYIIFTQIGKENFCVDHSSIKELLKPETSMKN